MRRIKHDFVSPSGNDNSSGTIDAPLATLSAAKEKAKNFDGEVTVCFREGTYTIENTVNFYADDKSDVVYKAYRNEKVMFTSGSPYTGFDECTVNGVRAFKRISARVQISIFFSTSKPRFQELAIPKADIFMLTMFPLMTFSRATIKTTNIIRDFWVCTLIIATFRFQEYGRC